MNGGQVILADEPTGALDSHSGEEVMAILHQLRDRGHTVIIVTHDPQVAAQAERVIEIRDGELCAILPPLKSECCWRDGTCCQHGLWLAAICQRF